MPHIMLSAVVGGSRALSSGVRAAVVVVNTDRITYVHMNTAGDGTHTGAELHMTDGPDLYVSSEVEVRRLLLGLGLR